MKNSIVIIALSILIFTACDKVKNPNQNPNAITSCTFNPQITKTDSNTAKVNHRIVMVEDYTGHTCGNCPRAAEECTLIANTFKDSVVIIAVHAGNQYSPPVAPDFPEDFRTAAGTEWDVTFGFSQAGLPKGAVNRTVPVIQGKNAWKGLVDNLLNAPQSAKIELTTRLDTVTMFLKVDVKTTFLKTWPNDVNLVVVMTEDSIVARQKDYFPPAGVIVENSDERPEYEFEHMMRGAVNSAFGTTIKTGPIAVNDVVRNSFSCHQVTPWPIVPANPKRNYRHMSVVAFVYDKVTNEILQADQLKIK